MAYIMSCAADGLSYPKYSIITVSDELDFGQSVFLDDFLLTEIKDKTREELGYLESPLYSEKTSYTKVKKSKKGTVKKRTLIRDRKFKTFKDETGKEFDHILQKRKYKIDYDKIFTKKEFRQAKKSEKIIPMVILESDITEFLTKDFE